MSSPTTVKPTILVLGATGGCVLAFLVRALNGGYTCSALARTPSKLTDLLKANKVPDDVVSHQLTVVEGNSKDSAKISEALVINGRVVDLIVSGVGGQPKALLTLSITLDDPNVCENTTTAILDAVKLTSPTKKPLVVAISTTGMSDFGRDIPIAMVPLYHWLLPVPHRDKKSMENLLAEDSKSASPVLGGFIVVRASMLTTGPQLGIEKVRVGLENTEMRESDAIGYTISREDVGNWVFEEVLKGEETRGRYLNHFVTITT